MRWLLMDTRPNDSLSVICLANCVWFDEFFKACLDSGHGGMTKNLDGDEDEGSSQLPYVRPFCLKK